jgi:hypothetical protein
MKSISEAGQEAARYERAMSWLCERTDASPAEIRHVFSQELARLEPGARIRSYLAVLTMSRVRATLRRKAA